MVGGSQVINVAFGLVRMKIAAVVLGPAGLGLVGLYISLMQAAATVTAAGIAHGGTRQIAMAHSTGGDLAIARIRYSLWLVTIALALTGAAVFWLASEWIAQVVLLGPSRAQQMGWVSLGVALTVIIGYQSALLTGLRRVGDLAMITIIASVTSTVVGLIALWQTGEAGLLALVLAPPLFTACVGYVFVMRLGVPVEKKPSIFDVVQDWKDMSKVGVPFMLASVVALVGYLAVRIIVQRSLGSDALGQFNAAWTISMIYLSFVLNAMTTDYFPRLTAEINNNVSAANLVNDQIEASLLLCAPVVLLMLGLAPWIIRLIYSSDFAPSIEILRWQLLGDVLKVLSFPLSYLLPARGAGKTYLLVESLAMIVLLTIIWIGLPILGVAATGVAYLVMYLLYLPLVWWLAARMIDFRLRRGLKIFSTTLILVATCLMTVSNISDFYGAIMGLILALAFGLWSAFLLLLRTETGGLTGRVVFVVGSIKLWKKK